MYKVCLWHGRQYQYSLWHGRQYINTVYSQFVNYTSANANAIYNFYGMGANNYKLVNGLVAKYNVCHGMGANYNLEY